MDAETQANIGKAIAYSLKTEVEMFREKVGTVGIPVAGIGHITDAEWDPEFHRVEVTINPGGKLWVLAPEELVPAQPAPGRHAYGEMPGHNMTVSSLKDRLAREGQPIS